MQTPTASEPQNRRPGIAAIERQLSANHPSWTKNRVQATAKAQWHEQRAASCSQGNFHHGNAQQQETQDVKQATQGTSLAWMACDDTSTRCIHGGVHQPSHQRVIDPLSYTDEHQPQAEQQGMGIGDPLDVNRKAGHCARCTKCNKEVVPVLDLEPGVRFIPHASASIDVSAIVAQGGAA